MTSSTINTINIPQQSSAPQQIDTLLGCLEELCRIHKRPRSASALKAVLPLVNGHLTVDTFIRAAQRGNLDSTVTSRPLGDLVFEVLPLVLLDIRGDAILLMSEKEGSCKVWNPVSASTSEQSLAELEAEYGGQAILVKPILELDERASFYERIFKPSSWFWDTLLRYRKIYFDATLASLVINMLAIAGSLFAMNVYDRVVPNRAYETLWVLAVGVCIAYVFEFLLRILRGYFVDQAGKRADIVMSSILYERVMGLRLEHRPVSAGAMASTLKEFEALRDFFTSATMASLVDLPFVFVFIIVIGLIGGPLLWIPLLAIPIVAGIGMAFQPALNRAMNLNLAEATQKHGLLVESIAGLETVKSLSAEGYMQGKWEALVEAASASGFRSKLLASIVINLTNLFQQIVYVLIIVMGVYLIEENLLTTGGLVACTILGGRAMAPLAQISALLVRYQSARHALRGLNRLVASEQERPENIRFLHRPELAGGIVFDNVSFSYPGQNVPALIDASFEIKPGERVAVLGRVGSGKTTLLKLILGLYRPNSGSIRFDGIDQSQIDPVDLRANIGYVEQDSRLFFGTLRENIAIVRPEAGDAEILEAARIAGVEEFARRHPHGYEMRIGEGGTGLSGGQRQCVATARAVLMRPNLMVMDEPTSGMDQLSETNFIKNMSEFLPGRTLILVTHKPSMMALVDKIVLMDSGRVLAAGPRDDILKKLAENERK